MLGLADKSAQRRLLGTILEGDPAGLLAAIEDQYALGVEPIALIRTLMDLVHRITVAQISGVRADAPSAEESTALTDWAKRLSAGQLHRLWQLLLKGHEEVRQAPEPLTSAQMALLRVLHAADLPDPGEMMKRMEELTKRAPAPSTDASSTGQGGAEASGSNNLENDWTALIEQVERSGRHHAASVMRLQVRPIALSETMLKFSRDRRYRDDISALLRDALFEVTGNRWTLEQAEEGGLASLVEREQDEAREREAALRDDPLVKAVFAKFPDARFVDEEPGVSGGHNNWSKTA